MRNPLSSPALTALLLSTFLAVAGAAFASDFETVSESDDGSTTEWYGTRPEQIAGASGTAWQLDVSRATLDAAIISQANLGRELVDLEIRWNGSQERFTALFLDTGAVVHTLIQGPYSEWETFFNAMAAKAGRYLDVEVDYFDGNKRYSSIFLEDGDFYGAVLRTTQTDDQFQANLKTYLTLGYSLIDFEAYTDSGGNLKYAGIWVKDPNQPMTHLYYGLQSPDVTDLVSPMAGRVIDLERYWDPARGYRYAMIIAQYPGGEWAQYRGMTSTELATRNSQNADGNTFLIDIDSYVSGGTLRFNGVWGDTVKSLHEVSAMPSEPDLESNSAQLDALIAAFEGGAGAPRGRLGLYARNLGTNQSIANRHTEPFYAASTVKTAIHVKLKREEQEGEIAFTWIGNYTDGVDSRFRWYVDERDQLSGPLNDFPGLGNTDWGLQFSVARFDQAMMQVSDNAAASLLVDHPTLGTANSDQSLNHWISGIPGVGKEYGLVLSIQDIDRTILWQGQQGSGFESEPSYFLVPPSAFEPLFRTGSDAFQDLEQIFPDGFPAFNSVRGHNRLYASGISSVTPRAQGGLMEKLWEGDLLDPTPTSQALAVMLEGTPLDNHPSFPSNAQLFDKGGTKGWNSTPSTLAISDSAIVQLGPDAVSINLFAQDGDRITWCGQTTGTGPDDDIRCDHFPGLAWQLLQDLAANLEAAEEPQLAFSPSVVSAGAPFSASCDVENLGGGDSRGFDVDFYASTNQTISSGDRFLGRVRVAGGVLGRSTVSVDLSVPFPSSVPPGSYWFGCIVDADKSQSAQFGEVGEWDEALASNTSVVTSHQLTVQVAVDLIFADGFESGNTSAW
ncbi:MAG: serine hydrolase [Thermoanaerobaculia bacterium]|nr:serine hydrolase [Thermoanaerobaculia bacterium]